MLNTPDLMRLVMVFMGPFSGFCAASDYKKGTFFLILFIFIGLCTGIGCAVVFTKLSYAALHSEKLNTGIFWFLYILIPLAGLLVVIALPSFLAMAVYR